MTESGGLIPEIEGYMQAGKLRKRLHIQIPTVTQDTDGGQIVTFATVETVWGEVKPLRMTEKLLAAQVAARETHLITLRYQTPLPPTYQLALKGTTRVFEPTGVVNVDERDRALQVTAIEKV